MPPPAAAPVDIVVPVKSLRAAKSRLRGAADAGVGDPDAHSRLALALVLDTLTAARLARVRTLLVVTADPDVEKAIDDALRQARVPGRSPADRVAEIDVVAEGGLPGLNAALAHGAGLLRARDPHGIVGALQSDLPALRPGELDTALTAATALFAGGAARAFCTDTPGDGTSLLLSAPGVALDPMFGAGSAARHAGSGAVPVEGSLPGLRRDVDTADDLRHAVALGVGTHTTSALAVVARGA
ncbi:2-phospho-L-lactate guanylyltransferase [Pseudonocardia sulfidoxydans]|uniref:2-phospho-L-lactate guanylyltransferase n=1 Tax=Pseudonocardia sulfidoxydans TaxID=54011 RepID=UPI001FEBA15C|nr:2-phospho-L-lactate guanylyltransferase [Pseudonocardia sulfidoxydans]